MAHQFLHTAAFVPHDELLNTPLPLYALPFPNDWRAPFSYLQVERTGRPERSTFEIRSLNHALGFFVPHLVALPNQVRTDPTKPARDWWLLAEEMINPERLLTIVKAWLEVVYGECDSYTTIQQSLQADDLQWEQVTPVLKPECAANGTAIPSNVAYAALPALLAKRLEERDTRIPIGGVSRPLMRVAADEGAELMTWPPVYVTHEGREYGYSYTVRLSLHTYVGSGTPRIHAHYGVRRWISQPVRDGTALKLRYRRRTVYLRNTQPWLGLSPVIRFGKAIVQPQMVGDQRLLCWVDRLPAIADRLSLTIPDADDLALDPRQWLEGQNGITAAMITHSERSAHVVKAGVSIDVHKQLTQHLAAVLTPEVSLYPPLQPLAPQRKPSKHDLRKDLRDLDSDQRLEGLHESVGKAVTIEIWWQTHLRRDWLFAMVVRQLTMKRQPAMPQQPTVVAESTSLFDALADSLDAALSEAADPLVPDLDVATDDETEDAPIEDALQANAVSSPTRRSSKAKRVEPAPEPAPEEYTINWEGLRVRIQTRKLGNIGSLFSETPPQKREMQGSYIKTQTERRIREIGKVVPLTEEPTLAIVEIPNYRDRRWGPTRRDMTLRDPKRAIRCAFARQGRVTKFMDIIDEDKQLAERAANTVREGLRQLGFLPAPIEYTFNSGEHSLPENLLVIGIWVVRLTRKRSFQAIEFPVAVLMPSNTRQVFGWIADGKGIRQLDQAMRDIVTLKPEQVRSKKREDLLRQVQTFLRQDVAKLNIPDVALLTVAQNARQLWPGLQNSELMPGAIRFAKGTEPVDLSSFMYRLYAIRLRTLDHRETAEWYTEEAERGGGFTQGIWQDPDPSLSNTFYNITGKGLGMSGSSESKQSAPTERYVIPSIVEILPFALPPEGETTPETWAHAVYQWRQMSAVTNDPTQLPIVLEYAKAMTRYAEAIGPWILPEIWDEVTEPDDDDEDDEIFGTSPMQLSFAF